MPSLPCSTASRRPCLTRTPAFMFACMNSLSWSLSISLYVLCAAIPCSPAAHDVIAVGVPVQDPTEARVPRPDGGNSQEARPRGAAGNQPRRGVLLGRRCCLSQLFLTSVQVSFRTRSPWTTRSSMRATTIGSTMKPGTSGPALAFSNSSILVLIL